MHKHINLRKIEKIIRSSAKSTEEKEELWQIVEEIVHHRVLNCILDNLDRKHHEDFLSKFKETSFNEELFDYLKERGNEKAKDHIKETIQKIEDELLDEINN